MGFSVEKKVNQRTDSPESRLKGNGLEVFTLFCSNLLKAFKIQNNCYATRRLKNKVNTFGNEENDSHQHLLIFPLCFQKPFSP